MKVENKHRLSGSGIVCGLEVTRAGDKSVKIQTGWGYTSTGLLIEIDQKCEYVYYRHLRRGDDRYDDLFQYFRNVTELFELLQTHQCGPETEDYSWIPRQKSRDQNYLDLNDKIIVLFKMPEKEVRAFAVRREEMAVFLYGNIPWDEIKCGNSSSGEVFDLWSKRGKDRVSELVSDYCLYNHLNPVMDLPVIKLRRFGYGTINFDELGCDDDYNSSCAATNIDHRSFVLEYHRIVDTAFIQLNSAFDTFHEYRHTSEWIGDESIGIFSRQWEALREKWQRYKKLPFCSEDLTIIGGDQSAVQYWYSLARDLSDAWNELRALAVSHKGVCEISQKSYPCHLVLGALPSERAIIYHELFRTIFRQPAVLSGENLEIQKMRFLYWRVVMMVKSFFVPGSDWDDTAYDSYLNPQADRNSDNPDDISKKISLPLRFTPSASPEKPLGKRAIPFYYDLADHPMSLHWYWDYDATLENRTAHLLSYHSDNEAAFKKTGGYSGTKSDSYTRLPESIHAFAFDMRGLKLIRIEGLAGTIVTSPDDQFAELVKAIEEQKKKASLTFKVITIVINSAPLGCERGIDHVGGVLAQSEFIIVLQKLTADTKYRVVGDFTLLP